MPILEQEIIYQIQKKAKELGVACEAQKRLNAEWLGEIQRDETNNSQGMIITTETMINVQ